MSGCAKKAEQVFHALVGEVQCCFCLEWVTTHCVATAPNRWRGETACMGCVNRIIAVNHGLGQHHRVATDTLWRIRWADEYPWELPADGWTV